MTSTHFTPRHKDITRQRGTKTRPRKTTAQGQKTKRRRQYAARNDSSSLCFFACFVFQRPSFLRTTTKDKDRELWREGRTPRAGSSVVVVVVDSDHHDNQKSTSVVGSKVPFFYTPLLPHYYRSRFVFPSKLTRFPSFTTTPFPPPYLLLSYPPTGFLSVSCLVLVLI